MVKVCTHRWSPRTDQGGRGYGQLLLVGACLLRHRQFPPDGRQLHGAVAIADSFLLGRVCKISQK
ncbi:MAG: hypothetical protein V7K18_03470 [Nostoc sp.]|uniref:hypothetical protein n=1 Tax=Nostoc sp. TaxID=1180 RepID=UPI002FF792DD